MARQTTILAVDDDPFYTAMLENVLTMEGAYHVLTATNVADAMLLAEHHVPALVITDRYMPGRDGFDFCRWLKGHPVLSDTMVMLLTASAGTENIVRGLDLGADDYLVKPFEPDELHSRVRALLRIKKLGDQLRQDNTRLEALNCALSENLAGVMHLLTHIIELRVPESSTRAEQAGGMVLWIGERLGLGRETLDDLVLAARIREIGKIVMPDEVLTTARPLSADQRETLSQFPLFGQMLVGRIPQLRTCAAIIRSQCENFDGSGLPDHLMGAQIPTPARILRAASLLEEMLAPFGPAPSPLPGTNFPAGPLRSGAGLPGDPIGAEAWPGAIKRPSSGPQASLHSGTDQTGLSRFDSATPTTPSRGPVLPPPGFSSPAPSSFTETPSGVSKDPIGASSGLAGQAGSSRFDSEVPDGMSHGPVPAGVANSVPSRFLGTPSGLPKDPLGASAPCAGPAGHSAAELAGALSRAGGTLLDPAVAKFAVEYLMSVSNPSWMVGKKLVSVTRIAEGMTIAADVCTAKGVKLLPKDTCLTGSQISRIQSHNRKDPILTGIYIYS